MLINNNRRKIKFKTLILICILFVFHLFNNYVWIKNDSLSVDKDVATHLNNQLTFFYKTKSILYSEMGILNKLKSIWEFINQRLNPYWSSFFYLNNFIINLLFGHTPLTTRFLPNTIYFFILIFSVFYLGKKYGNEGVGLLAVFIVSFFPGIFGASRVFGLDFPLVAMIALTFCILLLTENFLKKGYSILAGIIIGLCLLIKAQGIIFIVGPFSYLLYHAFIKKPRISRKNKLINLSMIFLTTMLIVIPWYIRYFPMLMSHFISHIKGNMITPYVTEAALLNPRRILYYLIVIIDNISVPYFLVFLFCLLLLFKNKKLPSIAFFLIWVAVPYIVFTILPLRDEVYYFPSLPAIGLIISLGITSIQIRLRKILYCLFFVMSIFNFFILSYYEIPANKIWIRSFSRIMANSFYAHPPRQNNCQRVAEEFTAIIQNNKIISNPIKIGIIEEQFNRGSKVKSLEYFLRLYNPGIEIFLSYEGSWPYFLDYKFLSQVNSFDYIIAFARYPYSNKPEFKGLKYPRSFEKANREFNEEKINQIIQELEKYSVLKKSFVLPYCISVYLLSKQKIERLEDSQIICQPKINWLIGEVISIEPAKSKLMVRYQDNGTLKERLEEFFAKRGITTYENVFSLSDIKPKDSVIIDYFITKENKKILRHINVDNISEIPYFSLEKPSGNIREKRDIY